MVAASSNLSAEIYCGRILQIRSPQSEQVLAEISTTGFGDAIFLRIVSFLKHQLAPLEGTVIKMAYAGWVQSKPNFISSLKKRLKSPGRKPVVSP